MDSNIVEVVRKSLSEKVYGDIVGFSIAKFDMNNSKLVPWMVYDSGVDEDEKNTYVGYDGNLPEYTVRYTRVCDEYFITGEQLYIEIHNGKVKYTWWSILEGGRPNLEDIEIEEGIQWCAEIGEVNMI